MRHGRSVLVLIGLTGLGCDAPAPGERVFVDLDAALAATTPPPATSKPLPHPPSAVPAKTLSISGTPARTVVVDSSEERRILERNRERAERELGRSLATLYQREAERAGQERLKELEPSRQAALDAAQSAVRAAFEAHAAKRGPKFARLTAIVGFPDPNPDSLPPTREPDAAAKPRLEEAVRLRAEIRQLDRAYEERVQELLAEAGRKHDIDLTQAMADIGRMKGEAIERAEKEAVAQVAKSHGDLEAMLLPNSRVELQGTAPQSAMMPGDSAFDPAPFVASRPMSEQERRQLLRSQVRIWAGVRGFDLTEGSGRDATAEFIAWFKEKGL